MANDAVGTYDPKKVIIDFGGQIIDGFADGTFLTIAPHDADGFKKVVGADGEIMRSLSADNSHVVTFTLLQSSSSNQVLSTIRNVDKQTGKNMKSLTITDLNGKTLGSWAQAWIRGDPELGFSKENTDRPWTIDTGQQSQGEVGGVQL